MTASAAAADAAARNDAPSPPPHPPVMSAATATALTFLRSRLLVVCFLRWKDYVSVAQAKWHRNVLADAHFRASAKLRGLARWRFTAAAAREERAARVVRLLDLAGRYHGRRLCVAAFTAWCAWRA